MASCRPSPNSLLRAAGEELQTYAEERKSTSTYFSKGRLSAVRLPDERFATLTLGVYTVRFLASLDERYVSRLRTEYGERRYPPVEMDARSRLPLKPDWPDDSDKT